MSVVSIGKTSIDGQPFGDKGQRQGHTTVGTVEASIPGSPWTLQKGITIRADAANTADIVVGNVANASQGFHIPPGSEAFFAVSDSSLLGIVAASGEQGFGFIGV